MVLQVMSLGIREIVPQLRREDTWLKGDSKWFNKMDGEQALPSIVLTTHSDPTGVRGD